MNNDNARNTILFVVCSLVLFIAYYAFVWNPMSKDREAAAAKAATAEQTIADAPKADGKAPGGAPVSSTFISRQQALAATGARVPIDTPSLQGSLALQGGRIDDLFLKQYDSTLNSGTPVELLRPQGARNAYFAEFGWLAPQGVSVPNQQTPWRLTGGSTLTPTTPVTLTWDNGSGLRFTRVISVDDQYMFTVKDTVANFGTATVSNIAPYGRIRRLGVPDTGSRDMLNFEGAIGAFSNGGGYVTERHKYKDWEKKGEIEKDSTGGWLGINDKYWLTALIPNQEEKVSASFLAHEEGSIDIQDANLLGTTRAIAAGRQLTVTTNLFAGAKRNEVLKGYEDSLGVPRLIYAIDWGWLFFLTRPIFWILEFFYNWVGNFGVAILMLTVVVKLALFPLANKAYASMSKMKKIQPQMEEIKKKHADDPTAQQQATLALFQKEKINPLAGCLPLLAQLPVVFALFQVLSVTIEMRHAPFFGWIQDLSGRDPTNMWNLFGLIPWDPATAPIIGGFLAGMLGLGVLAIIYGFTMWLQQAMNPPSPDPMQRKIFGYMPFIFTFIMAPFAAGLLVYWIWNNVLSIIQQYIIMHRHKVDNPIDDLLARLKKT